MNAEVTINLLAEPFLADVVPIGHMLAIAAKSGDELAKLALADWLEEKFKDSLTLRWTVTQLRA